MRFEESRLSTGSRSALLALALVAMIVGTALSAMAAKPMRWEPGRVGGPPCADVFLNPPDVEIDPDCGAMAQSSGLEVAAAQQATGALVEWEVDGNLSQGTSIASFSIQRGLTPLTLVEVGETPADARAFYDDWSAGDQGAWYQVIALDADGRVIAESDVVFAGPI